jgi:hypothetical protein
MRMRHAAILLWVLLGCESITRRGPGAICEQRARAYDDFVAANRECMRDEDCAVVGDCDSNADFRAVRAAAADEARELAEARCETASDGDVFGPRCTEGLCTLERRTDTCCGCPPDAGPDE